MVINKLSTNNTLRLSFYALVTVLVLLFVFFMLNFLFPFEVTIKYSTIITDRDGNILYATLSPDDKWRMKTELNEIESNLKQAFIEKEDKYFYFHPGVNVPALFRAAFNNILTGRKTSGASTITMQVVRLLEKRKRTYWSKLIEIFRALQLEIQYSKEEILQLYINLVPYGGNIEGVKSASVLYFGCMPAKLSLAQIVTLTIIPNRPTSLRIGYTNTLIVQERNRWLKKFEKEKIFPASDIQSALKEPLLDRRKNAPKEIPQLANRLLKIYPREHIIQTAIHIATQKKAEQLCYNYCQRLRNLHIYNAAVLILNNQTGYVEAYIGSPDFYDNEYAGQVDGITAVRSPGSTLKPFIYAICIDNGQITPKKIITDVPTDFDGYTPENFDKKFNGKVTVEKALAYSLNIPAVKLLEKLTLPVFIRHLKKAGFKHIADKESSLGLSLILGGCGVTLEELTRAFTAFANQGSYIYPRYLKKDALKYSDTLFSPQASYMITSILSQITRPDLPHHYLHTYHVPQVAWKTGTSYGRRDAWSIGYNKKYTVGVWVGNFSGEGVHHLTGADIATPLMFEIFNTIDYNAPNNWFFKPKNLEFRYVCEATGMPPAEYCTQLLMDYFIPKVSSIQTCDHLKEVFLSLDEKYSYCLYCLPKAGYKKKLFPNIAPELMDFYRKQSIAFEQIPPHNPYCTHISETNAPKIVSPLHNKEYIITGPNTPDILLKCIAHNEVKKVYWYVNDKLYKEALVTEKVFYKPVEGTIKISCSDDKGRNTDVKIIVRYE